MRLPHLLAFAAPVAAALLASAPAPAVQTGDDTAAFLSPDNWEGRKDIWTVADGKIVGETKSDPGYNTFLCSKTKYSDFELVCKVLLRGGVGNSGVQIRSARTDKGDEKRPYRVGGPQVDVGKGYWGSLYGEGVGGMMKASDPGKFKAAVKEDGTNEYYVRAKGTRITIKINGETMVDQDFPTLPPEFKTTKDATTGKETKVQLPLRPAPTEGIIAFQAHAGYPSMRVEYSDIRFRNLATK